MLAVVTRPSVVGEFGGLLDAAGAAAGGLEPGLAGVVDPEGYGVDAVAVLVDVAGDVGVGAEGGGEDEADFALLKDVAGAVALAGLGAGVGDEGHAEGGAVEVGGLAGVADVELDVVGALEGEEVGGLALGGLGERGCGHESLRFVCLDEDMPGMEGWLVGSIRGAFQPTPPWGLLVRSGLYSNTCVILSTQSRRF